MPPRLDWALGSAAEVQSSRKPQSRLHEGRQEHDFQTTTLRRIHRAGN
jgi:hypothetical protein